MREVERVIELNDITYAYPGGSTVIDRASLAVSRDERVGIIGPNGSGKTTLFHLVMGLLRPASGAISIFGREMDSEKDFFEALGGSGSCSRIRTTSSSVPRSWRTWPSGPSIWAGPVTGQGDRAGNPGNAGYRRFRASGQSQALARGEEAGGPGERSGHGPEVLILDEPTAGLDQDTRGGSWRHSTASV